MAIAFNGDYFTGASTGVGAQPITIAFWAKSDGTGPEACLVKLGTSGAGVSVELDASGRLVASADNGSVRSASSSSTLGSSWHHVAGVFAYASRSVWLDGASVASDVANFSVNPDTAYFNVAADSSGSLIADPLTMGELAIWAAELSSDELVSLSKGAHPLSIRPQSIVRYLPMMTGDLTQIPEIMGGNTLYENLGGLATLEPAPPIAQLDNRHVFAPRVYIPAWKRLAHRYEMTVLMGGVDVTASVDMGSLSVKDTGGAELETASFGMRTPPSPSAPYEWKELQVFVDYETSQQQSVFAGHVTRAVSEFSAGGLEIVHQIKAEGYKTFFSRSRPFSDYWKEQTVETIIGELLTSGEITGFTVQATATTVPYWTIDLDESVAQNIERLCKEYDWRWRVSWDKVVIVGPEGDDIAPFGISEGSTADYFLLFPAESVSFEKDGAAISNAVVLKGGTAAGENTDTFAGDGSTTVFSLAVHPISSVISIKVDGAIYSWGTMGYHSCAERDVLVHFEGGYIEFCDPPAGGTVITVNYTYSFNYTYTDFETASRIYYQQTLWELVDAPWISEDATAALYLSSLFALRGYSPSRISVEFRRAGLRAGQTILVDFPSLGLSATYLHIESIGVSIDSKNTMHRLRFSLRLGPADEKLGEAIQKAATRGFVESNVGSVGYYGDDANYLLVTGANDGASTSPQKFTNGIVGPSWKPVSDGATAIQIKDSAGSAILTVDTTTAGKGKVSIIGDSKDTFKVYDALGNTTFSVDTTNDLVGVGNGAPTSKLDVVSEDVYTPLVLRMYNNTATTGSGMGAQRARGTLAAPLNVQDEDNLTNISGQGYYNAGFRLAAQINMSVDETPSGSIVPGRIVFRTTNTSGTSTEAMRIISSQLVGIGTDTPGTILHARLSNATTSGIDDIFTVEHASSGTPGVGFGSGIALNLQSDTTANQNAVLLKTVWTTASHGARTAKFTVETVYSASMAQAMILGESGAVFNEDGNSWADFRIEGDTATHLFFVDASSDRVAIGTDTPDTRFHVSQTTGETTASRAIVAITHNSTGTPGVGFGAHLLFNAQTDTTVNQNVAMLDATWSSATHGSRKGQIMLRAYDATTFRTGLTVGSNGSASVVSVYGVTPVVRATTAIGGSSMTENSGTTVNDKSTFDGYDIGQVVKALINFGILT